MSVAGFVVELLQKSVQLWAEGTELRFRAPRGALTPALREAMVGRKAELLAWLGEGHKYVLTSFAQQRLWFLEQLEGVSATYNIPAAYRLTGRLDVAALAHSLEEIVRRHESLRTTFVVLEGQPVQVIAPSLIPALPTVDLEELDESERQSWARRLIVEEILRPFDLASGPLFRVSLLRLAAEQHILLLNMHHIVSDGWSIGLLLGELGALYTAFAVGEPSPLPALPIQYADFGVWQRERLQGEVLEAELSYWRQQLGDSPPALELPTDWPRPAVQTHRGADASLMLAETLSQALGVLSRREGATLFMTLLAAFKVLLWRYSGQTDLAVGAPIAGRTQSEVEGLIGFFLNTLVLRSDLSGQPSFQELLKQVREVTLGAYAHQDLPFEKLVDELRPERDLSRTPLFQVLFNMLNLPGGDMALPGLAVESLPLPEIAAKFDLTLYVGEWDGRIQLDLVYNADLFARDRMVEMLGQFEHLLAQIVAAPERSIRAYSLLTPAARAVLPDPTVVLPEPRYELVTDLFAAQAARRPQQPAICQGGASWTYGELAASAQGIARLLRTQGVQRGDVVAVFGPRSLGLIASMLGVFLSGSVLLTLDPQLPGKRRQVMLREAQVRHLLCVGLDQSADGWLDGIESLAVAHVTPGSGQPVGLEAPSSESVALPTLSYDDAAYIFFTSGTTAVPKGVLGCHKGLAHFLHWQRTTFDIGPHDRCAQLTALSFDVVLRDIFTPLTSGATLYLPEDDNYAPNRLIPWLEDQEITVLHTVPALAQAWLADAPVGVSLRHLRLIFFAGEPLKGTLVQRWRATFSEAVEIVNLYGPTETTLAKCFYQVPGDPLPGVQPIGTPLPETQILILGDDNRLCGVGEPGEIVVRTPFRSFGYINPSEEDGRRFARNPWRDDRADVVYYTGDRGRYCPDGALDILGRLDFQVKIRGARVELSEIESVLAQHSAVQEAVVLACDSAHVADEKRLVAYVVLDQAQTAGVNDVRHFLRERLPDYMIPSAFMTLDVLPLTPNGKIDRCALPLPDEARPILEQVFVAPRTPIEEELATVWIQVLGVERVGIHDNFFDLGGHSLLAFQVISRVRAAFRIDLPLRALFESPTVEGMAVAVARCKNEQPESTEPIVQFPTIVPCPEERYQPFPLTDIQQAYWIGRSSDFELGNIATHSYMEFETVGLDMAKFTRAWQRLIDRHDMLRAIVRPDGQQQILEHVPPYEIEVLDLRGQDVETVAARLEAVRKEMSHQVLPTDQWPLFDVRASRLDDECVRLHVSRDALISDAWSWRIFLGRELDRFYEEPEVCLPPLELLFRDYVLAEIDFRKSELYQRSLKYWQDRLATLPPAPELPLARAPASLTQPRFVRRRAVLEAEQWRRLKARAARAGLTPSAVLLAAFAEVLAVWSKNPRFTINLTLFNRLPMHPQVNDIVGDFTSLTLLEVNHSVGDGFEARVQRIQEQLWEDLDHRYVSGVWVLRELARMQRGAPRAIMPVVFTSTLVHNRPDQAASVSADQEASDKRSVLGNVVYSISQTPQVWLDHQVIEWRGGLGFNWDAVEDLFPEGLLDDMFAAYCRLLHRLADDEDAWQQATWQLLPAPAYQLEGRAAVNATQAPISDALLHSLFAVQVAQRPRQKAVVAPDRTLTYREFEQQANQVGHWLRAHGAKPNQLVAVVMGKGWQQVVAVLGVLAAGAAYLPVAADLPAERLHYLLAHGQVELALTQPWLEESLAWPQGIERLVVADESLAGLDDTPLEPIQGPEDLAYVIYTSGSTGLPKGVVIDHRGAVNTILDVNQRFAVGPQDRVLALSALNFDLSVYDIFGLLAAGGTIVVPQAGAGRDPAHWAASLTQESVTLWDTVPALMEMLVEYLAGRDERLPDSLRLVMLSGDWIPLTLPDRIRALAGGEVQVISLGGATEASIWSILYPIGQVEPTWRSVPYGKPMVNQTFHVLDEALAPRPTWVPGQLYIGGIGLAQGYWRDEAKTAASFVVHPRSGERLYRTGDLGRYLPDGNIEFLGREDFQVKVQGHRIELGEIEAALSQHPAVRAGVVVALGEPRGDKRLVAYVVPEAAQAPAAAPAWQDDRPSEGEGLLLDPLERLRFKLAHRGLRDDDGRRPAVPLTPPTPDEALVRQYTARRSYRSFLSEAISLDQLGELLSCLRPLELDGLPLPKYRYASAGSLYPVQTYLFVKPGRVAGLEGGTYYYHPPTHRLRPLSTADSLDGRLYTFANRAVFESAAFGLFLVGQLDAIRPLYGAWARDFCLLEAGLMSQLLETSAPECGLGLCQVGGLDFERIRHLFALNDGHLYLHNLLGGGITVHQTQLASLVEDAGELKLMLRLLEEQGEQTEMPVAAPPRVVAPVPGAALIEELQGFLRDKLPAYMVPATFVLLEALPLSPNGKVDRRALPAPETDKPAEEKTFVAPQTAVEQAIATAWSEVLQLETVGVHDSFFDLGGNSVHVVQVHSKLRELLDQEMPIVKLFEYPTIRALAQYVAQEEEYHPALAESDDRAAARRASRQRRRQGRSHGPAHDEIN